MEPELHKAMVLLLARCWEYKLKTEDGKNVLIYVYISNFEVTEVITSISA